VSSLEDIRALREIGVYGAILGKAMYTGAVDLREGLKEAEEKL
jgi:phosphoribosylformimino-5-aminoimidazole carboxamide ribotide isomerase